MKENIIKKLPLLDRLLPLWIFCAMGFGILLGYVWPAISISLESVKIADVSLPIAIGLLWMMYPVLAKVKYEELWQMKRNVKLITVSLLFNWVICPIFMFALAWLLLPDMPNYRTGLILVGIAPCIAMVLIWNMLAGGSNETAAVLVALNSVIQIFMYSILGYFFLSIVPGWFGIQGTEVLISIWQIAKSVLIFLGIPLLAGFLTRTILMKKNGAKWYNEKFIPKLAPTTLIGLIYTIVLMFSMQGVKIVNLPMDVLRIAIPLVVYFAVIWFVAFFVAKALGFRYEDTTSVAFTAASNNFELAIAVAVGVFGISSGQALATVVGPLIEVPALIGLVYISLWAKHRFYKREIKS